MKKVKADFDQFSQSYEQMLHDPVRNCFASGGAEFFRIRKRDLIQDHFRRRQMDTRKLSCLDVGCGKGELATMLRTDFARVAGCDPSAGMLMAGDLVSKGVETRLQDDPGRIPFDGAEFDFVMAVCVFHHVPPTARVTLLREMRRVLARAGTLAVIEHNPYNLITQLIVSRTRVDADASLLRPTETRRLFREAGLTIDDQRYFLFFPESLYRRLARLEGALTRIPFGGQYAVFGRSV